MARMAFIKDEEKQLLLDRYVDIEWCDDVTHVQCVRCHRVAINHHVSNCKHIFCHDCKKELSDKKRKKCPQCHEHVTQMDDQDFDVEVKIHQLGIFCPNKKYGCKYADQLRKIPTHLMTCVDTGEIAHPGQCTGTTNMDAVLQQITDVKASVGVLKKGLRAVKKKDLEKFDKQELKINEMDKRLTEKMSSVEKQVEAINLTSKKYTEDLESIRSLLESINQQNESHVQLTSLNVAEMRNEMVSMTQEMKTHHDKVNKLESKIDGLMKTEFNGLEKTQQALTEIMTRMELTTEERNVNMKMAIKKNTEEFQSMKSISESINQQFQLNKLLVQQTTANAEEMRIKMSSMMGHQQAFKNTEKINPLKAEIYEWTIKDVKRKLLNSNYGSYKYESEVFKFIGYEYDIKARISKHGNFVHIQFQFKNGNDINQSLRKNGFTTIKYIVQDQCNFRNKKDLVRKDHLRFNDSLKCPDWTFECGFPSEILSSPYVKDDCVKITMLFMPPLIDHSFVSNNGVLLWTVDNYKKRKEELSPDIWSPSFYTSPQGYRVRIRFILNFGGSAIVEVFFLTGEHDESLSMGFPHETTVTLFNQSDPSKDLVKTEYHQHAEMYQMGLANSKSIEPNGFIRDDSFLLKVVIEPSDLEPLHVITTLN